MQKRTVPKLWSHQKETIALLKKSKICFDMSDPGTGKTRAHLEAWWARRVKGGGCLLVVAPKSLLKTAWADDIRAFLPLRVSYSIARASNREAAFQEDTDVYLTNTDAVKWLAGQSKRFFTRFDTIIIDEITHFKHQRSTRTKAANRIKKYFEYRAGLTGTPNANTILDMWAQVLFLDNGQRLGKVHSAFRNATCNYVAGGGKFGTWVEKPIAEQAVSELINDICVRHDFDECMDIPPNHTYTVHFTPPPPLKKAYKKMEDEALLWLEDQGTVSAVNEGVLRNKLLQIASGAVYGDDDKDRRRNTTYKIVDRERYVLVADLVEARDTSIVFFNWKHQREELKAELDKRKVPYEVLDGDTSDTRRDEIVGRFQAGHYKTLLMHPKTGAHGLTLTRGRSTIFSSPIYEADFLKQGKHRIWRGGQTEPTETILIEARGTVESLVYSKLDRKTRRMASLLDMIKERRDEDTEHRRARRQRNRPAKGDAEGVSGRARRSSPNRAGKHTS